MRKHLQELVSVYGDQALVNLVNQKGYEQPIKDAYERYITEVRSHFLPELLWEQVRGFP